jgi:hypothetical protein
VSRFDIFGTAIIAAMSFVGLAHCEDTAPPSNQPPRTFAVETYVGRAYNYLDRMVDKDGLPYFDVFWIEPAEAAHDWPDFGDVTTRQLQGAIMARHLTGREARNEKAWMKATLARLDPEGGLLLRPKTSYCSPGADPGDQALTLYTLVTAYADSKDPALRRAIDKMIAHLPSDGDRTFIVKGLMTWARMTGSTTALEQARRRIDAAFVHGTMFTPDNKIPTCGHIHGSLRALVGAADYALYVKDPVLFSRVDAIYRHVKSKGTAFGFLPEVMDRHGDIISCETCALMDFVGLGTTLANNGHPEYWGDVERTLRNQLVESQLVDGAWLKPGDKSDTDQFSWREIGARMVGGYAGWSSPTHFLAARETLMWGGPELRGKTRAFQNCCGGSGTHAFFIVWKNAARFENGTLSVNLHIDKLLPQAEIRCYQPYQGKLTIALKQGAKVRVRIPDFVAADRIKVASDRGEVKTNVWGNYLELGDRKAGEKIEVTYPLPVREEEVTVGNVGFRQYRYRVTWKGDTVVRITPIGEQVKTAYSDFDKRRVEVFYGDEGPGRLYQREQMIEPADPKPAPLHLDDGQLDFWLLH